MANSVEVRTEVERPFAPGDITVMAVAHRDRLMDAKPIAGFLLRRRYHGDRFQIKNANEFSPAWMRFVDEPPKDWLPTIKESVQKSVDPAIKDHDLHYFMAEDDADKYLTPIQLAEKRARATTRTFAPSELQEERASKQMDHSSGQVTDKTPRVEL